MCESCGKEGFVATERTKCVLHPQFDFLYDLLWLLLILSKYAFSIFFYATFERYFYLLYLDVYKL